MCKEEDEVHEIFRKTRMLMEKKYEKRFEMFEIEHYFRWFNWKVSRDEVYTVKVKVSESEFVHAKIKRTPPLGMNA